MTSQTIGNYWASRPEAYNRHKIRNKCRMRAMVSLSEEFPASFKRYRTNLKKANPTWTTDKIRYEALSKLRLRHALRFNQIFVEELKEEGQEF